MKELRLARSDRSECADLMGGADSGVIEGDVPVAADRVRFDYLYSFSGVGGWRLEPSIRFPDRFKSIGFPG